MELTRADGLILSDDPNRLDLDTIHRWLAEESYWAAGRSRATVDKSIRGSRCYGVYTGADTQVAFTRVVTDEATFAWICDVFVDAGHRGTGVGSWLVRVVVDELAVTGIKRLLLATHDAHEVYRRIGFEPLTGPDRYMEIDNRLTTRTTDR